MPTPAETLWLKRLDERATPPTARVLRRRAELDPTINAPRCLSAAEYATLRAVIDRLVPQSPGERVEIAAVIDQRRADRQGDGWRYETMPPDDVALKRGLGFLDDAARKRFGNAFVDASTADQDALLHDVQKGGVDWPDLPAKQWFTELLGEAAEIYVSYPRTLAAMDFDGVMFAKGWPSVGLNERGPA